MTLEEFIKDVGRGQHFRVYQPNADCLLYESFLTVHSPYVLDDLCFDYNPSYYSNNHYCAEVVEDAGEAVLLKNYGKYEIFRIDASQFRPFEMKMDKEGKLCVIYIEPNNHIPCCNLYIVPPKKVKVKK